MNEEEFSIRDGFRWSPDGKSIAYWQFNTEGVERFTLINDTDALYPKTTVIPYPKPGTKNSAVRVGIVPAAGGETTWVKTPGELRDFYIPRIDWLDERTLVLQHMNRLQNTNDVLFANAETGEVRRVLRDESKAWVEEMDDVVFGQMNRTTYASGEEVRVRIFVSHYSGRSLDGARVECGGEDVSTLKPARLRRRVGYVFQGIGLFPHFSVAENIVFGLRVRKVPRADLARRLDTVAEPVGLRSCPECISGKHVNCQGDTWDEGLDALATCPCSARGHRDVDGRLG